MKKRFIAGAVCPRCGEMDKLTIDLEGDRRECVSCGFADQRPSQAQTELRTRVNRPQRRENTEAQPVKLMPAPSSGDSDS